MKPWRYWVEEAGRQYESSLDEPRTEIAALQVARARAAIAIAEAIEGWVLSDG
jgi:hypothetical protein